MNGPARLVVNGSIREYDDGGPATLLELIESMDLREARLVAEVNGEIVTKNCFASHPLVDGDKVELVKFVGGG